MRHTLRLAATILVVAAPLAAQTNSVAARVAAVREGTVSMRFPARPDVCGDGSGSIWVQNDRYTRNGRYVCVRGPLVVRIGRADNQTISIRKSLGVLGNTSGSDVELGDVSADEAARYLISLGRSLGGNSGNEALAAAAFAEAGDLSAEFRQVVRDVNAPIASRKNAMFWLGQTGAPTTAIVDLDRELDTRSLREHYTFVLSQRQDSAATRKLMDIARTDGDANVRKQAMFWLGQSRDPAAVKFFKEILTP
jgi:hypothetical protein